MRLRGIGASRPTPKSRSKPIRPASRPRAFAAIAPPASTAYRSACRRSTIARSPSLGACTRAREALDAVGIARSVFDAIRSISSMRGRARPAHWAAELKRALAEAGEHLSLYQLTIEPDTPFAALHAAGKLVIPDDDHGRELYDTTQEICAAHGLPAYEISNHARPGGECRHNLVYWRGHEYAGIGPGAHGRLDIGGPATPPRPKNGRKPGWCGSRRNGHGLITDDPLTREEMADEFLLMGLRLAEGIDIARYAGRSPARSTRRASPCCTNTGWSRRPPTAACASPCPAFPCWTRSADLAA